MVSEIQFRMKLRRSTDMAEASANVALTSIAESNVNFTFDLYTAISAESPGNLFYSPLSIQVILALVYLGAGGNTAQQLRGGLHLLGEDTDIEQGIEATMRQLKASDDVMLDIANRVFLKDGFELKKEFLQSAAKFLAGVETVDFLKAEEARKTINDWVEMKTHDKIKDIIPIGVLNGLTRMVLVNAVYFKAEWHTQFDKDLTAAMPFYPADGPVQSVDMMHMKNEFKYTMNYDLDTQVLALPYKGNKLVMMLFLPGRGNGLSNLESKLANLNVRNIMNNMYENAVYVYLPKFKMEYGKELGGMLQRLGMTDMFSEDQANFSRIAKDRLYVTQVLHKAFVDVSEEGTEAAAATAVIFSEATSVGSGPPPPVVFKADHPFLFFIMDKQTQLILFTGRYSAPPA